MKRTLRDSLTTSDGKRLLNKELFGEIAAEYDRVTPPLSFGRDRAWKRKMIAALPPLSRPRCLDIACGTGDLCELLAGKYPDAGIVGVDLSEPMLNAARARGLGERITLKTGDMTKLDFPDGSFDVVTGGYALRNAPDIRQTLSEIRRVLKPGGTAAFLDFSKPPPGIFQTLEIFALRFWGGLFGLVLHGNPEVYSYIAASLGQYPDRPTLHKMLAESGLDVVESRTFFFGVTERVTVRKR